VAVNSLFSRDHLLDEFAGLRHGLTRTRRKLDGPVFQHDLVKVASSQVMSGELQITGH
jgi:hypothetical protein